MKNKFQINQSNEKRNTNKKNQNPETAPENRNNRLVLLKKNSVTII